MNLKQVHITLEWVFVFRIVGFIDDDIDESSAGQFLVQPGRREVHIAGNNHAWFYHRLANQVFGPPALVRGHDIAVAIVALNSFFQVIEVAAPSI